ncbi:MAG: VWA domain-containing protein [Bacteroidetes bacterium]|nr:VWA domain-containing protein [Bacteroidota bacterium]
MKYLPLQILFLLFAIKAHAQFSLDKTEYDFGEMMADNERYIDFNLTNTGADELTLLRADFPDDVAVRYSKKIIPIKETGIIRVKINPTNLGKFERTITIYYGSSPKPFNLTIRGIVKELPNDIQTNCPDFNSTKEQKIVTADFTVTVLDAETDKPIAGARVPFNPLILKSKFFVTGFDGKFREDIPIGIYDIDASAKNYLPAHQRMYIGKEEKGITFRLEPIKKPLDSTKIAITIPEKKQEIEHKKPITTTEKRTAEDKPGELPRLEYKPNNIVFLIDVSASMDEPDKLPLLKESMIKMVSALRDIDKITIVTYATGTEVAMTTTTADNKRKIGRVIKHLKAGGFTQGGKGIRLAYQVVEDNLLDSGNNQVILATDGDFNLDKSDDVLYEFIRQHNEKGIKMSVVGCGKNPRALKKMTKIASVGNGNFIQVAKGIDSEELLIEEVKKNARR